jgi:two-component system response regulator YesN
VDKKITQGVTKLDLDAIALVFKMGESQLRRRVQEATGKNVVAYVTQLRMEKAMRLLREGSENQLIGDVAEKCGYTDVAYFSRAFRQHYGMTPTQARATRGDGVQQGNG